MRLRFVAFLFCVVFLGACERPREMDLIAPLPVDPPDICGEQFPAKFAAALNEYSFGFEEDEEAADEDFMDGARNCPREEVIPQLESLAAANGASTEAKAKAAYILLRLGHEKEKNGKALISLYLQKKKENLNLETPDRKQTNFDFKILSFIDDGLEYGGPSLMEDFFGLADEADGAYAEAYSSIIASHFMKRPEDMLRRIQAGPKPRREKLYRFIAYAAPKDELSEKLAKAAAPELGAAKKELEAAIEKQQQ